MEDCITIIWIKNGLYIPAVLIALGFPEKTSWSITVLAILMVIDFLTGIVASVRIDGFHSITSRRMTAGAVAKMIVFLIPFIVALVGKGIGLDLLDYVQGAVVVLILSEAYSNIGNIHSARIAKRMPEFDAVSLLLTKVRKFIMMLMESTK